MYNEEFKEILNCAIGYRECISDLIKYEILEGEGLDSIMRLADARYSLSKIEEAYHDQR